MKIILLFLNGSATYEYNIVECWQRIIHTRIRIIIVGRTSSRICTHLREKNSTSRPMNSTKNHAEISTLFENNNLIRMCVR